MRAVEHFVELYFSIGFTNKEILNLLAHQHHIVISIRTLERICKKMHLFRGKNQSQIYDFFFLPQCGPNTPSYKIHISYKYKYTSKCNIMFLY